MRVLNTSELLEVAKVEVEILEKETEKARRTLFSLESLESKNKEAARAQLLRIQLLLSQRPIK